ncbi:MAG: FkbM family methyltransferase [Gammaproteobacteria bacterium]
MANKIEWVQKVRRVYSVMRSVVRHPLHRGKRLKAAVRWARLQTAIYLTPARQITIPYVNGAVLNWSAPATSVMICARYGLGEYADMAFCLHMLRSDDLFCDVGANAGVYTVLAAHAVGCSVVAAEPISKTFDLLMQNIYANGLSGRVDARNVGVGRKPGRLSFTSSLWSYNHVVDRPGENTVEVEVLPLDELLAGRTPTVIKIDVEGFEAEVIAGAQKTLANLSVQAVLLEMCGHVKRYGATLGEIVSTLAGYGFHGPYWYDPEARKMIDVGKQEARKYNQIFIRNQDVVAERVTSATRYEIHETFI